MRRLACTLVAFVVISGTGNAQEELVKGFPGPPALSETEFIGSYGADGKFKPTCKRSCFLPGNDLETQAREAPSWVALRHPETVVEDYIPPARATGTLRRQNAFANFRDSLIAFVYGRASLLRTPIHVTTDSHGRLIVSDPLEPAVHVLDGRSAFRIAGGPGRRLLRPNGVAVDADDRIYVADGQRGLVLVYDPHGRFLRYIGLYRGENMFANPAAIAIDRTARRLYVVDTPVNELTVFDLDGNVLNKVGGWRKQAGVELLHPSEIAVGNGQVAVLDSSGTRIQVFDLDCRPLRAFAIGFARGRPAPLETGLAVDAAGNIYVSYGGAALLRAYTPQGRLVGALQPPHHDRTFGTPRGLWIDAYNRFYLTDPQRHRVHVFSPPAVPPAAISAAKAAGNNQ